MAKVRLYLCSEQKTHDKMKRLLSTFYGILVACAIAFGQSFSGKLDTEDISTVCKAVAQWQIDHHGEASHDDLHWTNACMYRGMMAWSLYSGDMTYAEWVKNLAEAKNYSFLDRTYHADDIAVGLAYMQLYGIYKEPKMIQPLKERAFWVASHPSDVVMSRREDRWAERWTWCDAIYMAAPVYAALSNVTYDNIYTDYLDYEFRACTDSLFDKAENLYYRDCLRIPLREPNGEKQFWSRGNGWTVGALVQILENLPENHPTRPYYEKLFVKMCSALLELQDKNGIWHASLLDPEAYPEPESSGSTFFVYGFSWGVRNGYLSEKEYGKAIEKGWKAICECVHPDGKLGYVQRIGSAPGSAAYEDTQVYGAGSFLLAGTEVSKYLDYTNGKRN